MSLLNLNELKKVSFKTLDTGFNEISPIEHIVANENAKVIFDNFNQDSNGSLEVFKRL